ncbi:MAG: lipopolysaccharide biosynthesis protein, partial [Aquabacterium sp.]|nr:lipopolysaccharide biosynthesis protein [Ferruginibacter sp.]
NLAYAYKMINKKVLLIDGNFDNPELSNTIKPDLYLEDFLVADQQFNDAQNLNKQFVVMGNRGEDVSLLELSNNTTIQNRLQTLRNLFDIILIEIHSLDSFNKAREWISFSDKVIPIFAAGQTISEPKKREIEYLANLNGKVLGWIMNKMVSANEKPGKQKSAKKLYA